MVSPSVKTRPTETVFVVPPSVLFWSTVQSAVAAWAAPRRSAAKAAVRNVRFMWRRFSYRPGVATVGMGRKDVPVVDASYVVVGYLPNDTDAGTR